MGDTQAIQSFRNAFINATNRDVNAKYVDCFYFDNTEEWANKLLELVLAGHKKATASSVYFYEYRKIPLPKIGNLNIITDWDGNPISWDMPVVFEDFEVIYSEKRSM